MSRKEQRRDMSAKLKERLWAIERKNATLLSENQILAEKFSKNEEHYRKLIKEYMREQFKGIKEELIDLREKTQKICDIQSEEDRQRAADQVNAYAIHSAINEILDFIEGN